MTDMGIDWICWTVYYACMKKKGNIRHITMKTRYPDAMQVALTSLYISFCNLAYDGCIEEQNRFGGITFRTR